MAMDTGISAEDRTAVADGLARLLASTGLLYLKTHGYHWNVTGPHFASLHGLFEEQYEELHTALDVIAERIRALGVLAPAGAGAFARLSGVADDERAPEAMAMVRQLLEDHETVARETRTLVETAEEAGDPASADLATQRLDSHEKAAWMLRATLEG